MGNKLPSEHFNEKIIIKKESMPGDYGHNPYERKAEELINFGVVNINKPQGPSSHLFVLLFSLFSLQRYLFS